MSSFRLVLSCMVLATLLSTSTIYSDSEVVFLNRIDALPEHGQSRLLVTRASGESMMFVADRGCSSISPGGELRVDSDGPEPDFGSMVYDLASDAQCVLRTAAPVLVVRIDANGDAIPEGEPKPAFNSVVTAIQTCLDGLGYDPGPISGQLDERTATALQRYRLDKGHERLQRSLGITLAALGMDLILRSPSDPDVAATAEVLFQATKDGRVPRP